ncbi:hypothetical protein LTR62_007297 [Meristemomyces frigidus]|uniref:Survival Motor Neuron Gemin2-binding domain-containing protein n=1 Tax=Meristemomyces frigidus TaxID=1508187 RepID=A0AAN7TI72_9PEZI|nr:hypothetical protein LTR62_007297 [Meristemomyces frigidus]
MPKAMSHEEMWDDSALVTSWNEAVEEYKKYHSMAARGENVDVVLEKAKSGELVLPQLAATPSKQQAQPHVNGKPIVKALETVKDASEAQPVVSQPGTTSVPPALLSGSMSNHRQLHTTNTDILIVQDEGMKNLMMSWYYAGYYTGLYEGRQQAFTSMQPEG